MICAKFIHTMIRLCLSDRFVGNLLKGQTVGVIGAGRIGSAYARMMVTICRMLICLTSCLVNKNISKKVYCRERDVG